MATKNTPSLEALVKSGEEHFQHLVADLKEDLVRLPETIFKSVFLPVFNGTRVLNDTDDVIKSWVSIAGAPGKEVQITDNTGKNLFKVPPLFDSSFIDSGNSNKGEQLSLIMAGYDLRRNVLPALGDNFLHAEIPSRVNSLVNQTNPNKEYEDRWKVIFDHYGQKGNANTPGFITKPGTMSDDDMSF